MAWQELRLIAAPVFNFGCVPSGLLSLNLCRLTCWPFGGSPPSSGRAPSLAGQCCAFARRCRSLSSPPCRDRVKIATTKVWQFRKWFGGRPCEGTKLLNSRKISGWSTLFFDARRFGELPRDSLVTLQSCSA